MRDRTEHHEIRLRPPTREIPSLMKIVEPSCKKDNHSNARAQAQAPCECILCEGNIV